VPADSGAVLKLQEHLREHRQQLEHERSQRSLADTKNKQHVKDKQELQKYEMWRDVLMVILFPHIKTIVFQSTMCNIHF